MQILEVLVGFLVHLHDLLGRFAFISLGGTAESSAYHHFHFQQLSSCLSRSDSLHCPLHGSFRVSQMALAYLAAARQIQRNPDSKVPEHGRCLLAPQELAQRLQVSSCCYTPRPHASKSLSDCPFWVFLN